MSVIIFSFRWVNLNSRNPNSSPRVVVFTPEDGRTALHPSSVMATPPRRGRGPAPKVALCDNPGANWLVYWLKQRSTKLFLFDVTLIYTLPLLFFGEFIFSDGKGTLTFYLELRKYYLLIKRQKIRYRYIE